MILDSIGFYPNLKSRNSFGQEANVSISQLKKISTGKIMAIGQLRLTVSQEMQQCIQNCLDCHSICLNTIAYCLQQGGMHSELVHIRLLTDCAQICSTSAHFMLRGSNFHARICGACAEVCQACAAECDRMGDDAQMKACANMCRRCAESCRNMAMGMGMV